jgi:hypothetical protein
MGGLEISRREAGVGVAVFVALMLGFAALGALVGWPNAASGWPLAVVVALIVAGLPLGARVLSYLQASRASVALPGGFKLDWGQALARPGPAGLPDNLVAPGVSLADSSQQELDRVADAAAAEPVIVVDLKDGRAWYKTRVFALAVLGAVTGSPRAIVLVGMKDGKPLRLGGWLRPAELVTALTREDPAYAWHWRRARRYLAALWVHEGGPGAPPDLGSSMYYAPFFREAGERTVLHIVVNQMRGPDPGGPGDPPGLLLEDDAKPPWVGLAELELTLAPWLRRRAVELTAPEAEQLRAALAGDEPLVLAVREGRYAGVIDVDQAVRRVVATLAADAGG